MGKFARDKYKISVPRQHQFALAYFDPTQSRFRCGELDFDESKQIVNCRRERPEAIAPVAAQSVHLLMRSDFRNIAIGSYSQGRIADVGDWNESGHFVEEADSFPYSGFWRCNELRFIFCDTVQL